MYVGGTEFASIAKELGLIEPPRPLTHEIYLKLVSGLGISFQKLEIYGMEENAFLARLYYTKSEQPKMMEIRPSDGLALALNKKTPIFIHKRLLKGTLSPQDQDTLNDLVKSVKF